MDVLPSLCVLFLLASDLSGSSVSSEDGSSPMDPGRSPTWSPLPVWYSWSSPCDGCG